MEAWHMGKVGSERKKRRKNSPHARIRWRLQPLKAMHLPEHLCLPFYLMVAMWLWALGHWLARETPTRLLA